MQSRLTLDTIIRRSTCVNDCCPNQNNTNSHMRRNIAHREACVPRFVNSCLFPNVILLCLISWWRWNNLIAQSPRTINMILFFLENKNVSYFQCRSGTKTHSVPTLSRYKVELWFQNSIHKVRILFVEGIFASFQQLDEKFHLPYFHLFR